MTEHAANRLVWAEIPVTDMAKAKAFYAAVLKGDLVENSDGPNPVAFLPYDGGDAASGHLYPGKPAPRGTGPTVHLAVADDLDSTMERIRSNGGEVVSDVVSIPSGDFFYALDPDGNSIGFFKMKS